MTDASKSEKLKDIEKAAVNMPMAKLCVSLAEKALNLPESEANFITFNTLLRLSGMSEIDGKLIGAANFLTSSTVAIFNVHAQFTDHTGEKFKLENEVFDNLLSTNSLVHPKTGETIKNAGEMVVPYFSLITEKPQHNVTFRTSP